MRRVIAEVLVVAAAWPSLSAFAQHDEVGVGAHRGQLSLTYQYISTNNLAAATGTIPTGPTHAHVINFEIDYAVSDRWTFSAGLPLVTKRYKGDFPHDPLTIVPPRTESRFIDDGSYHTYFQDWHIGASYLVKSDPIAIAPFASLGIPSNDYPFFAQAAVGQNLKRVELGTSLAYQPPFLTVYFNLAVSRAFVEKTLGHSVDHWRFDGEVGYFVRPRVAVNLLISGKEGDGLSPSDFPPPRNTELWYQHDRLTRHNYVNMGVGAHWMLSDRQRLSAALLRMVHAEDVQILKYAVSIGIARSF